MVMKLHEVFPNLQTFVLEAGDHQLKSVLGYFMQNVFQMTELRVQTEYGHFSLVDLWDELTGGAT